MKLRDFPFLADQNIDTQIVNRLRADGFDVVHVSSLGLERASDESILKRAFSERRVVLSHDADFGMLAAHRGEPFVGLFFLRPGHIETERTWSSIQAVLKADLALAERFIVIADHRGTDIVIRVRTLPA